MHMSLSRRTQILLDDDRYAQLERRANQTGRSVAAVIREAIDEKLSHDEEGARRRDAVADLLAAPAPAYAREPDWEDVKDDLRARSSR
jgi:predicted DNA-binding protein